MARSSTSGQGRPKGTPNKVTADARKAIAKFVDENAGELQKWLRQVAEGDVRYVFDKDGNLVEKVRREPDPGKAFDLYQKVVQYHVPRLAQVDTKVQVNELPKVQVEFVDVGKSRDPES